MKLCECGCGQVTLISKVSGKPNKFMHGHNQKGITLSKEHKRKIGISNKDKIRTEETKRKLSLSHMGYKHTKEQKIKSAISHIKGRNSDYCDAWFDKEFKNDCREVFCKNVNCKKSSKKLILHHIDLEPANCCPANLITFCISCHATLHAKLYYINNRTKPTKDDFNIDVEENKIIYTHKINNQELILNII